MPINVVCPGCLKRFQVSERFAGLKGPCPNCNTIIDIPKEQVKIHAPEEATAKPGQPGKTVATGAATRPLARVTEDFTLRYFIYAAAGTLFVLVVAALFGRMGLSPTMMGRLGALGLIILSVPIAMYGYLTVRDREELFVWTGRDLAKRSALCGGGYALLWILMECVLAYTGANTASVSRIPPPPSPLPGAIAGDHGAADSVPIGSIPKTVYTWVYIILFAGLSLAVAHVVFDFDFAKGFAHYCTFFIAALLLRWLVGLGWVWQIVVRG